VGLRLSQLAAAVGGELQGADGVVERILPLDSAGPDALGVCLDARRAERLPATRAAGVLLPRALLDGWGARAPCALILVADARLALARALVRLQPEPPPEPGLHPTACVSGSARVDSSARVEPQAVLEAGAEIGPGCLVGAGAVVQAGARLGAGCRLGPRVVVGPGCRLGAQVRVGAGSVLGSEGFGLARDEHGQAVRIPQVGGLEIEDDVELGALCSVARGTLEPTRIGRGAMLDDQVHVGHNAQIGAGVVIAAQTGLAGSVTVEAGAVLGGQVGVADHVRIGRGAQVGGQSGVATNVPPGARVAGYPAVPVRAWLVGLKALRRLARRSQGTGAGT
jgi:UDP-3-O-[3-hydroxymyristoyl] glucosamine N-acyltransferase